MSPVLHRICAYSNYCLFVENGSMCSKAINYMLSIDKKINNGMSYTYTLNTDTVNVILIMLYLMHWMSWSHRTCVWGFVDQHWMHGHYVVARETLYKVEQLKTKFTPQFYFKSFNSEVSNLFLTCSNQNCFLSTLEYYIVYLYFIIWILYCAITHILYLSQIVFLKSYIKYVRLIYI